VSCFVLFAWVVSSVFECESWLGSTLKYGGTTRISTRLGTDPMRGNQGAQRGPRNDRIHLAEKPLSARHFPFHVIRHARQRPLLAHRALPPSKRSINSPRQYRKFAAKINYFCRASLARTQLRSELGRTRHLAQKNPHRLAIVSC